MKNDDLDIIEFQDRVGYVDVGICQQKQTTPLYENPLSPHVILKEPKPQKQVPIIEKKKPSFQSPQRYQPLKKSISEQQQSKITEPFKSSQPYGSSSVYKPPRIYEQPLKGSLSDTQRYQHSKSAPEYYQRDKDNDYPRPNREIKDLMVSKLYELADMISHIHVDESPRPSSSTADQPLRKKPSRSTMYPERQRYNKSVESYPDYPYYYYYYPPYYYKEQQRPRRKSFGEESLRRKGSSSRNDYHYGQYYYGYPDTYYNNK